VQVVVLLLLVASLALLVSGLITGNTPLVIASIAASLLAAYAISRYRGRRSAGGSESKSSRAAGPTDPPSAAPAPSWPEPVAAADLIARHAPDGGADVPATPDGGLDVPATPDGGADVPATPDGGAETPPTPGGEGSVPDVPHPDGGAEVPAGSAGDDPPVAETDPPLRSRGDEPVWVVDGRPRYHLEACGFLAGRDAEPVPLRQAVEDGFTPCALCDPDSGLVAGANRSQPSIG